MSLAAKKTNKSKNNPPIFNIYGLLKITIVQGQGNCPEAIILNSIFLFHPLPTKSFLFKQWEN